ncbi:MAG: recombinase family protein, partial [Phycisphaerae bacterium]
QKHEGWLCLPEHYDDGGFTGGNLQRPAMQRLLADIAAGRVDCVVVYKVDRLSRSLMDFARIMETFEKHGISFVSVTQQFNTTHSMGRLTLNILLSFAQFEREIISERTRDKIAATRRKGKWSGGMPVLGYNVAENTKLMVNPDEALRVEAIFELYLQHRSLRPVVDELYRRRWRTKEWVTRKGRHRGGRVFTKNAVYQLLTNVTYRGMVRYKQELHPGEHRAIVKEDLWQRVQALLKHNNHGGGESRSRHGALLKGLLYCSPCQCRMGHTYTARGAKRYRYYTCLRAHQGGWDKCPSPSIPAGEIEAFVVAQIEHIGKDSKLITEALAQVREQSQHGLEQLTAEQSALERDLQRRHRELGLLVAKPEATARLADLQDRIRDAEQRLTEVRLELDCLAQTTVEEASVASVMGEFGSLWEALTPAEQARLLNLLIQRIEYDGAKGTIVLTFHPAGISTFAREYTPPTQEMAA